MVIDLVMVWAVVLAVACAVMQVFKWLVHEELSEAQRRIQELEMQVMRGRGEPHAVEVVIREPGRSAWWMKICPQDGRGNLLFTEAELLRILVYADRLDQRGELFSVRNRPQGMGRETYVLLRDCLVRRGLLTDGKNGSVAWTRLGRAVIRRVGEEPVLQPIRAADVEVSGALEVCRE